MTDDNIRALRNGDMPLLDRIDVAIRRITSGEGQMRIPVEATDPDVVLFDCRREIERLQVALANATAESEHFERAWHLRGDEIERLRVDADRYRWLRANSYLWPTEDAIYSDAQVESVALWHVKAMTNEGIDAAIDAARKEEGK